MHKTAFWLTLTLICILIQAFFAMMEMSAVSFNRVRLQYYVNKGSKRARWLYNLLQNPSRLFGTALFGVNCAMQIGSECSRRFYFAMGLNPDLAPLTQVFIVLVFAELTPLFAARKFSGQVIMAGIPILYTFSKILIPVTWSIGLISKSINYLITGSKEVHLMDITRDELQRALEEQSYEINSTDEDADFHLLVGNILNLQKQTATHLMTPLHQVSMISQSHSVTKIKELLDKSYHPFLPVYFQHRNNITGVLDTRDLIKAPQDQEAKDFGKPPWFMILDTSATEILNQFRHNKQKVGVVLDKQGQAIGIITLDNVLKALFGESIEDPTPITDTKRIALIDRTLDADMTLKEFNETFSANLEHEDASDLEELVSKTLGHIPEAGELLRVGQFLIRIEEVSLGHIKKLHIKTVI